jgi:DNA-binding MarR family transcriptional regulator
MLMDAAVPPTPAVVDPAAPLPESAARVLRRFRRVFSAVRSHFHEIERQAGIGGSQVWALSLVREHPGMGVKDLARAMDIHPSTASNLVKSLVLRQMLEAVRQPDDRRAVCLQLRPAGAQVLGKVPGPMAGVLPAALADLDSGTLDRLDQDLGRLIERLGGDEKSARIPLADL